MARSVIVSSGHSRLNYLLFLLFLLMPQALALSSPTKYFHENPNSSHLDLRFSIGTPAHHLPPTSALTNLLGSYVTTMRDLGVETWLAHGTLLGWYWGKKLLPWDVDIDMHVSQRDLFFLSKYYNMTVYPHPADSSACYLLDINPLSLLAKASGDDARSSVRNELRGDRIDARWIDMTTGIFVDVTALTEVEGRSGKLLLKAGDGHTYLKSDVYPLQFSTLERLNVYLPQSPKALLIQEYTLAALEMKNYFGYEYDDELRKWVIPG